MKTNKPTDIFRDTMASAELCDKPPGVKLLDWIVDRAEREGSRKRTVAAAVRARIAAHEATASAKQAKAVSVTATAAVKALPPTPASLHATYRTLMKKSPAAAGKFWNDNEAAIKAELAPPTFKL